MSLYIVLIFFLLFTLILVGYSLSYRIMGIKIAKRHETQFEKQPLPSATILICAKNEAQTLPALIPALLKQVYPHNNWKILIINDASSDQTSELLATYNLEKRIQVHHITNTHQKQLPGKKEALSIGAKLLNTELVLLTDGDCIPNSDQWLMEMVKVHQKENADIIVGYGAYSYPNTSLLQQFIQFETLHTAMQYGSYAELNTAYMGVGRNLLYKSEHLKMAFEDTDLLDLMRKTSSGDDDLIITYFQNTKIKAYFEHSATTVSRPPSTFKQWLRQKSRHTSSSKYYSIQAKKSLSLYAFSHFGFLLLLIIGTLLFIKGQHYNLLGILALGFLIRYGILYLCYKVWQFVLKSPLSVFQLMLLDSLWAGYNLLLSPYIFWKNKAKWN